MTQELFEVLDALCSMWIQYCPPPTGHMCMSAGEATEEVLDKYKLLINKDKFPYGGEINWERYKELESEKEYVNQDKWISVEDKLPEKGARVLAYDENFGVRVVPTDVAIRVLPSDVTHWQPLPNPPKQ